MATVTQVEVCKSFDHVIITLDHDREDLPYFVTDENGNPIATEMREGDVYRVSGTGLYSTTHGFVAGNTRVFSYRDKAEATAKANGWFRNLVNKGYARVR